MSTLEEVMQRERERGNYWAVQSDTRLFAKKQNVKRLHVLRKHKLNLMLGVTCDMFFDKDKLDVSFSIVKIWICWVKLGKKYCNVSTIY